MFDEIQRTALLAKTSNRFDVMMQLSSFKCSIWSANQQDPPIWLAADYTVIYCREFHPPCTNFFPSRKDSIHFMQKMMKQFETIFNIYV